MDNAFKDKTAKILVVEGSSAARTLITEVSRKLGFSDLVGVPTLKDALGVMEAESVDWLITPILKDEKEKAGGIQRNRRREAAS